MNSEPGARTYVSMETSEYGTPVPTLHLPWLNPPRNYRQTHAVALRAAARVEELSMGEQWVVNVEGGLVSLELKDGTLAEANRGRELLEHVALERG